MRFESGVIGVDEAGRGALVGPVVAAAVALNRRSIPAQLQDSKKMTARARHRAYQQLQRDAVLGVGIVGPRRIERMNILGATMLAMEIAVSRLLVCADSLAAALGGDDGMSASPAKPIRVLIDGNQIPRGFTRAAAAAAAEIEPHAMVGGDGLDMSIAAASIVAKVTRDRLMQMLHIRYPRYEFARHKGYPTCRHRAMIAKYGPCRAHRRTFRGVA